MKKEELAKINNNDLVRGVSEEQLPEVISSVLCSLSELKLKVNEANRAADDAAKKANNLHEVKFGKKKAAIEELQDATQMLATAQEKAMVAQDLSFQYQEKLAKSTKYLFGLGAVNISNNRTMIRKLKMFLEEASPEEMDEFARQEFSNVINQLKAQEDIMNKQASMQQLLEEVIDESEIQDKRILSNAEKNEEQDRVIDRLSQKGKEYEKLLVEFKNDKKKQDAKIEQQALKDKEHDRLITENAKKNEKQDAAIVKQIERDKEHDKLIAQNAEKNEEQDAIIVKQTEKDKEHDKLIAQNAEKNEEQDAIIVKQTEKGKEHDKLIAENTKKNEEQDGLIQALMSNVVNLQNEMNNCFNSIESIKQLKADRVSMVISCVLSGLALALAIINFFVA